MSRKMQGLNVKTIQNCPYCKKMTESGTRYSRQNGWERRNTYCKSCDQVFATVARMVGLVVLSDDLIKTYCHRCVMRLPYSFKRENKSFRIYACAICKSEIHINKKHPRLNTGST